MKRRRRAKPRGATVGDVEIEEPLSEKPVKERRTHKARRRLADDEVLSAMEDLLGQIERRASKAVEEALTGTDRDEIVALQFRLVDMLSAVGNDARLRLRGFDDFESDFERRYGRGGFKVPEISDRAAVEFRELSDNRQWTYARRALIAWAKDKYGVKLDRALTGRRRRAVGFDDTEYEPDIEEEAPDGAQPDVRAGRKGADTGRAGRTRDTGSGTMRRGTRDRSEAMRRRPRQAASSRMAESIIELMNDYTDNQEKVDRRLSKGTNYLYEDGQVSFWDGGTWTVGPVGRNPDGYQGKEWGVVKTPEEEQAEIEAELEAYKAASKSLGESLAKLFKEYKKPLGIKSVRKRVKVDKDDMEAWLVFTVKFDDRTEFIAQVSPDLLEGRDGEIGWEYEGDHEGVAGMLVPHVDGWDSEARMLAMFRRLLDGAAEESGRVGASKPRRANAGRRAGRVAERLARRHRRAKRRSRR